MTELNSYLVDKLSKLFLSQNTHNNEIGVKLLTKGEVIVPNYFSYVGGVGNFVERIESEEFIDCIKLKLNLEEFLQSEWIKDCIVDIKKELEDEINNLTEKLDIAKSNLDFINKIK